MVLNANKKTVLNPLTNRYINTGSAKHKRLIKDGIIKIEPEPLPEHVEVEADSRIDKVSALVEVVGVNYKKLKKTTSDADLQDMLRQLLNAKLGPSKKKTKPKKKKRKSKYKSRKVESSSDSSESSSESSDSD